MGSVSNFDKNPCGVILQGDLSDHETLLKAVKEVDVVISAVGGEQIDDQVKLIAAIKQAGNIKVYMHNVFCYKTLNQTY